MTEAADLAPIREAVRALCAKFPRRLLARPRPRARLSGRIRRGLDQGRLSRRADPGGIRRQRPDHDGRRRHHGGNPGLGLQRRRLSRPDVHDGHGAASRQRRTEGALSAGHRARRIAAAGLRGDRADLRHRYAQSAHHGGARRRSLRRQRPEDLDLARRTFRSHAAVGAHHAAGTGGVAHRRPVGVPHRHARGEGQGADHSADPHHDESRHHRGVFREHAGAGRQSRRRGGRRAFATSSPA